MSLIRGWSCALVAIGCMACGGALKYQVKGTPLAAAADAKVVADVDVERSMTTLSIDASNLTPAERVLEGGSTYAVWARRDASVAWQRLGALELSNEGRSGTAKLTVAELAFD